MLNLSFVLEHSFTCFPDKTAVILDDYRLSYRELNGAANKMANALCALGVQPGQKVAMMLPNIPSFVVCYYGILKAGATVVPLNVLLKRHEIIYHLDDSEAVALIVWDDVIQEASEGVCQSEMTKKLLVAQMPGTQQSLPQNALALNQVLADQPPVFETVATMPDDTAVILYTSGTTGRSKGAELTHFNMFSNAMICGDRVAYITPDDVGLAALPLFHSFGQTAMLNACMYSGGTVTMQPRFEPKKTLEIMQRDSVTFFCGVPSMYALLLRYSDAHAYDLSALRCCISGGAAMPVNVLHAFNKKYNITIQEGYGLSETAPVAAFNHQGRPPKPGSIGTQAWGVEMRVVDENDHVLPPGEVGEIVIRGHNVMKGYYKSPDVTATVMRGGWFHTGDLAYIDEEGYFFIVDRLKDVIIRGGINIYPREIEEVLYGHPAVAEAAVVGVAHSVQGERVKACVVLKPDEQVSADELLHYCRERLADYKVPRFVEFLSVLPKTATGKIVKRELVES